MKALRIATRKSALALWQAEHVAARLRAAHPDLAIELVPMTTRGDDIVDRPLAALGGKGLFLKELEVAMLEDRADIAVHSFKDVPMELDAEFAIGAVLERADAADAFVSNATRASTTLPRGARVGTSSLRRQAQLRALRPDLELLDLRGNVNTRLAKLDAGDYDAIVLACAGLDRLGLGARIRARLAPPDWLPAAGAGRDRDRMPRGRCVRRPTLLAPLDDRGDAALRRRRARDEPAAARQLHGADRRYCIEVERGLALWGLVGDAASGRARARGRCRPARMSRDALGQAVARCCSSGVPARCWASRYMSRLSLRLQPRSWFASSALRGEQTSRAASRRSYRE